MPPFSCNNSSLCLFCVTFNTYAQRPYDVIPVPRHWDPEKLIVHYATFSIKSWIPVSSTGICHANCNVHTVMS
ncbi:MULTISPECIES: WPE palindromic element domain-containing protein [unclassified Wolbachia]|uniref:WPE palindromic element domain-containing protein n=1 Tax=unclassified Wolbachia TaxID=2640676 RepID=UPI00222F6B67|nr:WPE palindromic element domain-containing protein [Wolbachia endosymbiont (group A) of Apoderus coryli]